MVSWRGAIQLCGGWMAAWLCFAAATHAQVDEFGEAVPRLRPRVERSERNADRAYSAALFVHGRLLAQRERPADALRKFQRAWRYDEGNAAIFRELSSIALELDRRREAVRYAALQTPSDEADLANLLRWATIAAEDEDWRDAARLFDQATRLQRKLGARDFTLVLMELERGRVHLLRGEIPAAVEAFDVVREALAAPDRYGLSEPLRNLILDRPEQTYGMLAETYKTAQRWDDAKQLFEARHAAAPNEGLRRRSLARLAAARGDWEEARRELEAYLQLNVEQADQSDCELWATIAARGEADERSGAIRASERLDELQSRAPENLELMAIRAKWRRRAGRHAEARELFQRVLDREPDQFEDDAIVAGWLEEVIRGDDDIDQLKSLGRVVHARLSLDEFQKVLRPVVDGDRRRRLGAAWERVAKQDAPPATDANSPPGFSQYQAWALALLAAQAEDWKEGEIWFARAAEGDEPGKELVWPLWGAECLARGQPARAAAVFQRLVEERVSDESRETYFTHWVGALALADRAPEAVEVARKGLGEFPESLELRMREAWALARRRAWEESARRYGALLDELDGQHEEPTDRRRVREIRLALAHVSVQRGERREAEEWLEQVLDEWPADPSAQNDLAYLWAEAAVHLERAMTMSRAAVAAEPRNLAYRDTLGWVLYRSGKFDEALRELRMAADRSEAEGVVCEHLGDCHRALGQVEEARGAWRRAAQAYRREKDAEGAARSDRKLAE